MLAASEKTVVLGPEYDQRLRRVLKDVVLQLGGKGLTHEWAIGGSQELETVEVEVRAARLIVEAETYVGLSIRGPSDLVDEIHQMVNEQLSKDAVS